MRLRQRQWPHQQGMHWPAPCHQVDGDLLKLAVTPDGPLATFRLIRRVSGIPARIFQHVAQNDRGRQRAVVPMPYRDVLNLVLAGLTDRRAAPPPVRPRPRHAQTRGAPATARPPRRPAAPPPLTPFRYPSTFPLTGAGPAYLAGTAQDTLRHGLPVEISASSIRQPSVSEHWLLFSGVRANMAAQEASVCSRFRKAWGTPSLGAPVE